MSEQIKNPSAYETMLNRLNMPQEAALSSALTEISMAAANRSSERGIHRLCRFFRLEELLYDGEKPTRGAWENFLSAVHMTDMNFVYIIRGDTTGTHIYFGLAAAPGTDSAKSVDDYARDLIEASFQGMFRGSRLVALNEDQIVDEVFDSMSGNRYVNVVTGIPSLVEKKRNEPDDYQGIDRLISAMHGEIWQMIVVCEPVKRDDVIALREEAYELYDALSMLAKNTVQSSRSSGTGKTVGKTIGHGTNKSKGYSKGTNQTKSTNVSEGHTESVSINRTESKGETLNVSKTTGRNRNSSESVGETSGQQTSRGSSSSESRSKSANHSSTDSYDDGSSTHGTADSSSSQTGSSSSTSESHGSSRNRTTGESTSTSETEGKSRNTGTSESQGKSRSDQRTTGSSESVGKSETQSVSEGESSNESDSKSDSINTGTSLAATFEIVNKKASDFMKYIDETLLPRLSSGSNRGMFNTAVYLLTEARSVNTRLRNNVMAIFQGSSTAFTPLMTSEPIPFGNWFGSLSDLQIHGVIDHNNSPYDILFGRSKRGNKINLATCLTSAEAGIIAGLPLAEVPGIALRRYVPFGLNPSTDPRGGADEITLGQLVYGDKALADNAVRLQKPVLNKHIFVTGITGSGKTVTCKRLLQAVDCPFLVIEPAKTEYPELIVQEGMDDLIVFTIGSENGLPLRFNPFEMLPGENLTAHIDMVKAAFMNSFDFEASMPQIFEMAMYRAYRRCGWDIDSGEYDEEAGAAHKWPTLSSFRAELEAVVKDQKFGAELEGNYRGSLISRIDNLTYGAKGKMLDCRQSIDFQKLLRRRVVIEMEDLKSPADKALIMALIMGRLIEAVKYEHRRDRKFQHITLIEEAHRLLSKVMPGDGEGKKYSVGMFTDMLAEIRKYGESLIIVDQIPNKLAEDVLKNTATKIVHKLVAQDDKEVIGDTMMLEDDQKKFLSNLLTGRAIVFTENWHKPVCVQVDNVLTAIDQDELDQKLRSMERATVFENLEAYHPELPRDISLEDFDRFQRIGRKALSVWTRLIGRWRVLKDEGRQAIYERLPRNFCTTLEEAMMLARIFVSEHPRMPIKAASDFEGLASAFLASTSEDFSAFKSKFGDLCRHYRL